MALSDGKWSLKLLGGCLTICIAGMVYAHAQTGNVGSTVPAPTASSSISPTPFNPSDTTAHSTTQASRAVEPLVDKPLPDVATLMHQVEVNQRKAEAIKKDYIYHSVATEEEIDGKGRVKKSTVTEADHFYLNGVEVRRLLKKDGKDLSPDELTKENERLDKEAAKGQEKREKADAKGKETDSNGNEEITVSRWLELGAFTTPRRVELNGRPTIAIDYTGDSKAKTRNASELLVRELAGTIWIDEQDCALVRIEGHFAKAFKLGAGLFINIKQGTRFTYEQTKVNDEIWLPARIEGFARLIQTTASFAQAPRFCPVSPRFPTPTRLPCQPNRDLPW
jgi:hypothetical protein